MTLMLLRANGLLVVAISRMVDYCEAIQHLVCILEVTVTQNLGSVALHTRNMED